MQTVVTILLAVLVFGALIFIHELGHFMAAKAVGVRVEEFSLGMGPVLFQFGKKETKYSLRLFPIGGYVSMAGEDPSAEEEDALKAANDPGAFFNKKVWQRVIVVVAGATMNILLGFCIMLGITAAQETMASATIAKFDEGAVSSQKLQANDEILKINGSRVHIGNDIVFLMMQDDDGSMDMTVRRDGEVVELTEIPFGVEEVEDGIHVTQLDFKVYGREKTFFGVIHEAFFMTTSVVRSVWTSLIDLITGKYGLNQLSGPVGAATAIGQAGAMGLQNLLMIVVLITVNLGVFNLLPLPALDGGRLLFLIIEAIRRKPVPPKYEGYVHTAGFLLLMLLMLVVTFNDILKLFR